KLWFCTNNKKDVYEDMLNNPEIEISVSDKNYAWIRLNGKAVFENNMNVKEACMLNPIVKGQYNSPDNPIFEVFYLDNAQATIADFSGNPPKKFSF
ncbi:pyridoxamine 5'-phosphate oxidase family protein, partial [Clostridium butyricum]